MSVELPVIENFYREVFQTLDTSRQTTEIKVEFYSYIGINHTIRYRNGKIFVRISDIFKTAPADVQKALAYILVAKLLRKKIPSGINRIYREFASSEEIRAQALDNKKQKGRKIVTSAQGDFYDLNEIFDQMNALYFDGRIEKPTLTWSARKTFRRLGHHDPVHETIVISKSLDDKKVPRFVVEYVVFHEMLHIFHPVQNHNGRRYHHTRAFRRDEEKFAFFEEAESWIEKSSRFLKRKASF